MSEEADYTGSAVAAPRVDSVTTPVPLFVHSVGTDPATAVVMAAGIAVAVAGIGVVVVAAEAVAARAYSPIDPFVA